MNYSGSDRELLTLISYLQRFKCYLEGTDFEIFTDNQVLKHFFTKPSKKPERGTMAGNTGKIWRISEPDETCSTTKPTQEDDSQQGQRDCMTVGG
jgi:hypothetical protein